MSELIGIGWEPVKELSLDKLENFKDHRRLRVFYHKGVECCTEGCYNVGSKLIITADKHGNEHIDVFTHDNILMNVDHFIPKSKNGTNHLLNLFPMCYYCNIKKSNVMPDVSEIPKHELELMVDNMMAFKKKVTKVSRRKPFGVYWKQFIRVSTFTPVNHRHNIMPYKKLTKRDLLISM